MPSSDPETDEFLDWLRGPENDYTLVAEMPNGMWCGLKRLLYHWTMHIGVIGDKTGYEDRYCYADLPRATAGLMEWQSRGFADEPTGWRKHPASNRCRNDDGDPATEAVGWG